jgi:phage protein D
MNFGESYKRPVFRVEVDGKDVTSTVRGRLISLTLTDNRGFEADQLDLVLDDSDGKLDLPPRGAEVRVAFGWADTGLVDKGSYTVDEVSHSGAPDTMTIRARSADLRSGLTTQRERSWHNITLGDLVREIADENGLIPSVVGVLAAQIIDHIDQTNESAANLLSRLAGQFDAIATVKGGKLLFIHAAAGTSASGKPLPAITITRQSGDSHQFNIADRDTYTHVKSTWYDKSAGTKGEVIWGKTEDDAENNRTARMAAAQNGKYKALGKISKSRDAAKRLAKKTWKGMSKAMRAGYVGVEAPYHDRNLNVSGKVAYGEADELKARQRADALAKKDAARTGAPAVAIESGADNIKTLRHVYASPETARNAAHTEWRKLQRGMAEFSITLAHGRPDLTPEQPAAVQGFKPAIDSTDWMIVKVTHNLNDNGLTTALALEIRATEIPG